MMNVDLEADMKKQDSFKQDFFRKLKGDMIVIAVILTAALLLFLIPSLSDGARENQQAIILQDGVETGRYGLWENDAFIVQDKDKGYNLVLISEGSVQVTDADCPDRLCVRQRSISRNGESIICLPHKLVILVESPKESDLDAVTN